MCDYSHISGASRGKIEADLKVDIELQVYGNAGRRIGGDTDCFMMMLPSDSILSTQAMAASKLILALIATGASAFVAPSTAAAPSTVLGADLTSMPGIGKETGDKPWDPYGFATKASTDTLGWYRAAEIKHGRVAMLAFTGFVVQSMGGGMIPFGAAGARAPLSAKPFEALGQLGGAGLIQIVLTIGFIELYSETIKPHYTKGGTPGYLPIIAPSGLAGDVDLRAANKELKNGRLAMIGMMGFFAAAAIPGSVPFLAGVSL